jgi:hypothetical protein
VGFLTECCRPATVASDAAQASRRIRAGVVCRQARIDHKTTLSVTNCSNATVVPCSAFVAVAILPRDDNDQLSE